MRLHGLLHQLCPQFPQSFPQTRRHEERPGAIRPPGPRVLPLQTPHIGVKSTFSLIFATVSATSFAAFSRSASEMISTGVCM